MARMALSSLACVWTVARSRRQRSRRRAAFTGWEARGEEGRTHGLVLLALRPQDAALAGDLLKLGLDELEEVVEALRVGVRRCDDADDRARREAGGLRRCSRAAVHEAVERVRGGGGGGGGGSCGCCSGRVPRRAACRVAAARVGPRGGAGRHRGRVEGDGAERAVVVHAARGHCAGGRRRARGGGGSEGGREVEATKARSARGVWAVGERESGGVRSGGRGGGTVSVQGSADQVERAAHALVRAESRESRGGRGDGRPTADGASGLERAGARGGAALLAGSVVRLVAVLQRCEQCREASEDAEGRRGEEGGTTRTRRTAHAHTLELATSLGGQGEGKPGTRGVTASLDRPTASPLSPLLSSLSCSPLAGSSGPSPLFVLLDRLASSAARPRPAALSCPRTEPSEHPACRC